MEGRARLSEGLLRFGAGWAGSLLLGFAVFGLLDAASRAFGPFAVFRGMWRSVFDAGRPPFQCVTVGAFLAAVFALVRGARPAGALGLAGGVVLVELGTVVQTGWGRGVSRPLWWLSVGAGAFAVAAVYDGLAARGQRLGKWLVSGPLLGGVYLAATPAALLETPAGHPVLSGLLLNALLGLVIGDGVAFGVELVELLPRLRRDPEARSPAPAVEAG